MQLSENIRLFLFDMDGTIYLGNRLFDFTADLLSEIKAQGKRYMFMTNNSSKSVDAYIDKLGKMGIKATKEDFITSAQATAHYLKNHLPEKRFYVCGTASLVKEFSEAGLNVTDKCDDAAVTALVMGFDTELTFEKLEYLSRMLCTRDMPYIATHPDTVCPTEYGSVPDCGAFCEMLYHASGKKPLVVGKPEPLMPQLAMEWANALPSETMVIGDRLHTDIACGLRADTQTLLVFSGETTPEILAASPTKPHFAEQDCGVLLRALRDLHK